ERPHGHATVSGERRLCTCHCIREGCGKTKSRRHDPRVRTPGHWDVPFSAVARLRRATPDSARKTPGGGLMPIPVRFPILISVFSLLVVGKAHAQTAPITITETVVV